jgi:hypothetical protein
MQKPLTLDPQDVSISDTIKQILGIGHQSKESLYRRLIERAFFLSVFRRPPLTGHNGASKGSD